MDAPTAQLRIAPTDPQKTFPWMDPEAHTALAIPLADLELWRGRPDVIKVPGYIALRFSLLQDQRYADLRDKVLRCGLPAEYGLIALVMAVGYAARAELPGVLAFRGRPVLPSQILTFWQMPTDSAASFTKALNACLESGWLVQCDLESDQVQNAYAPVRTRTRTARRTDEDGLGRTRTDGRGPEREPAPTKLPRVADSTDERTNERTDARTNERTSGSSITKDQATEEQRRTMRIRPRNPETGQEVELVRTTDGLWRQIPLGDPLAAYDRITCTLLAMREKAGLDQYPESERDLRDLRMAVIKADQEGRMADLLGVLTRAAEYCEHGGGFRVYLQEAKFLRSAPEWAKNKRAD